MLTFQYQPFSEDKALIDALLPMVNTHGVGRLGAGTFAPKTTRILQLWKAGVFHVVLAKKDNTIVGYQLWIVNELLFADGSLAMLGPVYFDKSVRGSVKQVRDFVLFGVSVMRMLGATDVRAECDADQPTLPIYLRSGKAKQISTQVKFL